MSCCSGDGQTRQFECTLTWRSAPDSERSLTIIAKGAEGAWTGEASARFDFADPEDCRCGDKILTGRDVVVRVTVDLKCIEAVHKTYMTAALRIVIGSTNFRTKLRPIPITCAADAATAEWPNAWLGALGDARFAVATKSLTL
jgi:hypothetical protein